MGAVENVAFRLPKAVLSDGTLIGYTNNNDGHDAPLSGSIEVVKGPKSSPTAHQLTAACAAAATLPTA